MDIRVQRVVDRNKLADGIHKMLDTYMRLLDGTKMTKADNDKLRVLANMNPTIKAAVQMVQQETLAQGQLLIAQRLDQLGFDKPRALQSA